MSEESPKVTDPICGMSVAPATAAASVEHAGHSYTSVERGAPRPSVRTRVGAPTSRSLDDLPAGGESVHPDGRQPLADRGGDRTAGVGIR
jgi:hypothetical protein